MKIDWKRPITNLDGIPLRQLARRKARPDEFVDGGYLTLVADTEGETMLVDDSGRERITGRGPRRWRDAILQKQPRAKRQPVAAPKAAKAAKAPKKVPRPAAEPVGDNIQLTGLSAELNSIRAEIETAKIVADELRAEVRAALVRISSDLKAREARDKGSRVSLDKALEAIHTDILEALTRPTPPPTTVIRRPAAIVAAPAAQMPPVTPELKGEINAAFEHFGDSIQAVRAAEQAAPSPPPQTNGPAISPWSAAERQLFQKELQ